MIVFHVSGKSGMVSYLGRIASVLVYILSGTILEWVFSLPCSITVSSSFSEMTLLERTFLFWLVSI